MISGTKGTVMDPMQALRVKEYPLKIEDASFIVNDNLEEGILGIYEYTGGLLNIQQSSFDPDNCRNITLIAQITIGIADQKDKITIEKIFCCYGFEELVCPMIYHVISFAKYLKSIRSISISETERENWFIQAGCVLQDFLKRKDGYYEYRIM